jgi:2-keto-3-deoxy-L-arabinonate dehydratase
MAKLLTDPLSGGEGGQLPAEVYGRILPLINYENRQCGLRAAKTVIAEGGIIRSEAVRHPLKRLHPGTRAGLIELAGELKPLAMRWGR